MQRPGENQQSRDPREEAPGEGESGSLLAGAKGRDSPEREEQRPQQPPLGT